jgi:tetratricopeptide (TPR) repeat protein
MDLGGRHVDAWMRRVDPEYDNLRAAFAWAGTRDDTGEAALRLAGALRPYWALRGHLGEGEAWLDAALARGSAAPAAVRARALLAKSNQCGYRGDLAGGMKIAGVSLALFRQTDDRHGLAWCLETLANNLDDAPTRVWAEEALHLFRELGSQDGVSRALRALGTAAYLSGDHAQAVEFLEQALAAAQEVDDWRDVPVCLARLYDADPARALGLCAREVARVREVSDAERMALIVQMWGILLLAQGAYERARLALEESVQWEQRAGTAPSFWFEYPFTLLALGLTELSLGHVGEAVTRLAQSRKLFREGESFDNGDIAQLLMASALTAQGDLAVATDYTHECLRYFHRTGHRPEAVCALVQAADLAHRRREVRRATVLLGAAGMFGPELDVTHSWSSRILWRWYQNAQPTIVEPTLAAARAALGDAEFTDVYATGQRMTLDQAVEYALGGI